MLPSPAQIKAARALLGWRQADLAEHSGVSTISVKNIEGGKRPRPSTMNALQAAFNEAGVEFLEKGVTVS